MASLWEDLMAEDAAREAAGAPTKHREAAAMLKDLLTGSVAGPIVGGLLKPEPPPPPAPPPQVAAPALPAPMPAPAPPPVAPKGPALHVGLSAPAPAYEGPGPSLAALAPAPAEQAPATALPAEPPPPPPPTPEQEFAAAQQADKGQWWKALLGLAGADSASIEKGMHSNVASLMERRDAAEKALKAQAEQEKLAREKALDSNEGPLADRGRMLVALQRPDLSPEQLKLVTPNMVQPLLEGAKFQAELKHQAAQEQHLAAQEKQAQAQLASESRHQRTMEGLERQKLGIEAGKIGMESKAAKDKDAATQKEAARSFSIIKDKGDELKKLIAATGTSGGLTGPGRAKMEQLRTEIAEQALKLRSAANPGAQLRPNAIDEEKALIFQPGFLQREGTATNVIDAYLKNKQELANSFGNPAGAPGGAHPQDSEAVAWAKANPNDPRAHKILAANGI